MSTTTPDLGTPELGTPQIDTSTTLRAGKPPVGTGASPLFAQLISLAFIGLAVVAVQHLLVQLGAVTGTSDGKSWLSSVVTSADGIKGSNAVVLIVGIVAVVLGVLLLPVVLKPRPRKGLPLTADTGVYLRPRDLARVAESALDGTDTVTKVKVKATRRKLKVVADTVAGTERNGEVTTEINSRLEPALAALEKRPRVKLTLHNERI